MRKTAEIKKETNAEDYVAYTLSYLLCPEDRVLKELDTIVYAARAAVVFAEHREAAIAKLADKIGAVRVNIPGLLGTRAAHDRFYVTDSIALTDEAAFYTSGNYSNGAARLGKVSFTDMPLREFKALDGCIALF